MSGQSVGCANHHQIVTKDTVSKYSLLDVTLVVLTRKFCLNNWNHQMHAIKLLPQSTMTETSMIIQIIWI